MLNQLNFHRAKVMNDSSHYKRFSGVPIMRFHSPTPATTNPFAERSEPTSLDRAVESSQTTTESHAPSTSTGSSDGDEIRALTASLIRLRGETLNSVWEATKIQPPNLSAWLNRGQQTISLDRQVSLLFHLGVIAKTLRTDILHKWSDRGCLDNLRTVLHLLSLEEKSIDVVQCSQDSLEIEWIMQIGSAIVMVQTKPDLQSHYLVTQVIEKKKIGCMLTATRAECPDATWDLAKVSAWFSKIKERDKCFTRGSAAVPDSFSNKLESDQPVAPKKSKDDSGNAFSETLSRYVSTSPEEREELANELAEQADRLFGMLSEHDVYDDEALAASIRESITLAFKKGMSSDLILKQVTQILHDLEQKNAPSSAGE